MLMADRMCDAVLDRDCLAAELAADAAEQREELRREAEHQARDEAVRTPYSLAWALDRADAFSKPGTAAIPSARLFEVQADPWATDVTPLELVACLMWCTNGRLPFVRAALRAYVLNANSDAIKARAADLLEAACPTA